MANRQDGTGLVSRCAVPVPWGRPDGPREAGAGCSRRLIAGIPTIDFILLAGDLVDRGNERTNWDHFFLRAAGVFDRVPLMPCVGNHEYLDMGPRLYRAFFELPRNGPRGSTPTWSTTSSVATPASPCSTARSPSVTPIQARRQAEWLDATLQKQQGVLEIRDVSSPRLSFASLARYAGLARALGADLRQAPRRFRPARTRSRLSADVPAARPPAGRRPGEGTIYLIAVSGDKFVDQAARDYIEVGRTGVSTYQTIRDRRAVEPPDLSRLDRGWQDRRRARRSTSREERAHEAGPIGQWPADQLRSHASTCGACALKCHGARKPIPTRLPRRR